MGVLKHHFRPEFLNRVDEIVLFKPLTVEQIKQVIELLVDRIRERLKDRKITLHLTDKAKELIAKEAYDPIYGARPLRRYLQTHIETAIAKMIIKGDLKDGDSVVIDVQNNELVFRPTAN